MDKQAFIKEVTDSLCQIFKAERAGVRTPSREKHRCEGFMRAGTFLGIISQKELSHLMQSVYQEVFGESIEARKKKQKQPFQKGAINYSLYDMPTYDRLGLTPFKEKQ